MKRLFFHLKIKLSENDQRFPKLIKSNKKCAKVTKSTKSTKITKKLTKVITKQQINKSYQNYAKATQSELECTKVRNNN